MRRLCITVVLVPALLVAAAPAQARTTAPNHRQEARHASARAHGPLSPRATRSTVGRASKFTYGRT